MQWDLVENKESYCIQYSTYVSDPANGTQEKVEHQLTKIVNKL